MTCSYDSKENIKHYTTYFIWEILWNLKLRKYFHTNCEIICFSSVEIICFSSVTKRNIDQWNKIESPRDKSMHLWTPYIWQMIRYILMYTLYIRYIYSYIYLIYILARIYNREKTFSLTSGAGKTGQPLVKEWN